MSEDAYLEKKRTQLMALISARISVADAGLKEEKKYLSKRIHYVSQQIYMHNKYVKGKNAHQGAITRKEYGKPFKEFTDEEVKAYNAEKSKKYRERKRNEQSR